jgi:hypothetical protein
MRVLVDAELADQLLQFRERRQHERHAAARHAPAGLVVVAVDRARDVTLLERLDAAAVDGGAHVEHEQVGIVEVLLQPRGGYERRRAFGPRRNGEHEQRHDGDWAEQAGKDRAQGHRSGLGRNSPLK